MDVNRIKGGDLLDSIEIVFKMIRNTCAFVIFHTFDDIPRANERILLNDLTNNDITPFL